LHGHHQAAIPAIGRVTVPHRAPGKTFSELGRSERDHQLPSLLRASQAERSVTYISTFHQFYNASPLVLSWRLTLTAVSVEGSIRLASSSGAVNCSHASIPTTSAAVLTRERTPPCQRSSDWDARNISTTSCCRTRIAQRNRAPTSSTCFANASPVCPTGNGKD
jgi:hypothetical protein